MEKLRKIFVVSVMMVTILSLSVVVVPNVNAASAGSLIKMNGNSSVYYYAADGKRYVFPNEATYFSWYGDFSQVVTISQTEMYAIPLGANVTIRPGTKLVKITTNPNVYAVEPNGSLVLVPSEAVATALWGSNWAKRVVDVSDAFFTNYTINNSKQLTATAYPTGSLVKFGTSADVFYINADGKAQKIVGEAAFTANRLNWNNVITSGLTMPTAGSDITGNVASLTDTASGAGGTAGAGSGLTVAIASVTPASATYIRNSNNTAVSQAVADFTKINFTAANDGDVTVTTLKLTRGGISADTDLSKVYLYDGDTMLAENNSFSSKIVTFSNSAGLFTVAKGTTKTITVKADISGGTATVSGIILGINAASDITTNGAAVSGSFPINGNQMAVGTVTDLGYANISSFTTFPATMDPGKTGQELWRFNVQSNNQDMLVTKIKLTVVGTVSTTDLANFYLADTSGTKLGGTISSMNSSKEVLVDLSASPYKITSGQTKTIVVYGDVVNGSGRTFKFTIRKVNDFLTKDNSYGISVAPLVSGAAFTLIDANSGGNGTSINSGTVTTGIATDSASGNIASAATGVSLAKYTLKANGEDTKINYLRIKVYESGGFDLKNGKLYFNGSQVGSTNTQVNNAGTAAVFTVNQIIPGGQTAVVEYKADVVKYTNGLGIPADDTIHADMGVSSSGDATGQSSLSDISMAAVTGRTVTVKTGLLTAAKNLSLNDYVAATPTGVRGATNLKVASFVLTAGAGESVTVSQLVVRDAVGSGTVANNFGANFQNLTLKNGSTALASTQGTLSSAANATFTFSLSPSVKIAAGQQLVVDVYADSISSGTGFAAAAAGLQFYGASATGDTTSANAAPSGTPTLQNLVLSAGGGLTITSDSATPVAAQLVMGQTDLELARIKFTASSSEDINISRIKLKNTGNAGTSLSSVKLFDGTTQVGSSISSFDAASNGYAEFVLATNYVVPKGTSKTLIVKASVNNYPNATSGGTETVTINAAGDIDSTGASSAASITETLITPAGNTMTVVRTKITVAKDTTSPAGSAGKSAEATIAVFSVTNTSTADNQDAKISDLAVRISKGGTWTTTASSSVKVYRDSVNNTNLLGTKTFNSGNAMTDVAFAGWVDGGGDSNPAASSLKDVTIGSGATVKLYVTANTLDAPTSGSITASLNGGDVKWEDGVSTGGSAFTTVDSLPVLGGTLTY